MAVDPARIQEPGACEQGTGWREDAETRLLVLRIQHGEGKAAGELYERYFGRVYAYLRASLRHHADAEDLAQQVFASALEGLARFDADDPASFRGWLFRIARNELVNERRRRRRVSVLDPREIVNRRERERVSPDVAERVERWALEDALARLPEPQRQVLMLRFFGDLRIVDISWVLGISVGAADERLRRGLKALPRYVGEPAPSVRVLRSSMQRRQPRLPVLCARRMALLAG